MPTNAVGDPVQLCLHKTFAMHISTMCTTCSPLLFWFDAKWQVLATRSTSWNCSIVEKQFPVTSTRIDVWSTKRTTMDTWEWRETKGNEGQPTKTNGKTSEPFSEPKSKKTDWLNKIHTVKKDENYWIWGPWSMKTMGWVGKVVPAALKLPFEVRRKKFLLRFHGIGLDWKGFWLCEVPLGCRLFRLFHDLWWWRHGEGCHIGPCLAAQKTSQDEEFRPVPARWFQTFLHIFDYLMGSLHYRLSERWFPHVPNVISFQTYSNWKVHVRIWERLEQDDEEAKVGGRLGLPTYGWRWRWGRHRCVPRGPEDYWELFSDRREAWSWPMVLWEVNWSHLSQFQSFRRSPAMKICPGVRAWQLKRPCLAFKNVQKV